MVWASAVRRCLGGKVRLVGDLAADNAEGSDEGEPVWVDVGFVRGPAHEGSDTVVGEQECPYFLFYHVW